MRVTPSIRSVLPEPGPVRTLAWSTLANTIGMGLFVTMSAIYFVRSAGLSEAQVGLGLTIAALVGLLSGIPAGHLADVLGPRRITILCKCIEGGLLCGYAVTRSFAEFVVVATLVTVFESAGQATKGALIAAVVPPEQRVRTRAYLRAVINVGASIGAMFAGFALVIDTREAYLTLIYVAAALYLFSAMPLRSLPEIPPQPRPDKGPTWVALGDRPYLALTLLNAVLCLNYSIFTLALPLFIAQQTSAPPSVYAVLSLINTITVILLQVRVSRGTETVVGAARAQRRSGVLLAVACVLYALADGQGVWLAVVFLACGALVHVGGELLQAAGQWGLSFELAPDHAQGQYQGLYSMGSQLANVVTPAVATVALVQWGWPGWVLFGVLFLTAGAAVPVTSRWAERTRPVPPGHPARERQVSG
ncbi:MFS transporter [Streptomyces sp. NPDC058296]